MPAKLVLGFTQAQIRYALMGQIPSAKIDIIYLFK